MIVISVGSPSGHLNHQLHRRPPPLHSITDDTQMELHSDFHHCSFIFSDHARNAGTSEIIFPNFFGMNQPWSLEPLLDPFSDYLRPSLSYDFGLLAELLYRRGFLANLCIRDYLQRCRPAPLDSEF